MDRWVALLRGINVGGKNKLPMTSLADLFRSEGCEDVRTFIQSGNVIFRSASCDGLAERIAAAIFDQFKFRSPVILRSAAEIRAVLDGNPFAGREERLHVMFLANEPAPALIATLDPKRSTPDEFKVRGQDIYLHLPNGVADTKLTNAYFDSKLKTVSTGRNWRTVTSIWEMMK